MFLPGTHTAGDFLFLYAGNSNTSSISLSGMGSTADVVVTSNIFMSDFQIVSVTQLHFWNNSVGAYFSDLLSIREVSCGFTDWNVLGVGSIAIHDVMFSNSDVTAESGIFDTNFVTVDNASFSDTLVRIGYIRDFINIRNSNFTTTPAARDEYCIKAQFYSALYIASSIAIFDNVFISTDQLPCQNTIFAVSAQYGVTLSIIDSSLSGKNTLIRVTDSTLHLLGTVSLQRGKPAIQAFNSTVALSGSISLQNGDHAIQAVGSMITLAGDVSFINNTGYTGGAVSLSNSYMTIFLNSHVVFRDNHADHVGGAIFSTGENIVNYLLVGVIPDTCQISFGFNSEVEFINNTARNGGSSMYGITVSYLVCDPLRVNSFTYLFDVFKFDPDDNTAVSSDPLRVCICNEQEKLDCVALLPDQNIPHLHYTVYPGQNFTIPAAVVGFNFALTSGSVYAQFLSSDASLGSESQYVYGVSHTKCTQLQYSVLSDKKQETLVLANNGQKVEEISSGMEGAIKALNENSIKTVSVSSANIFNNPAKYYNNSRFVTDNVDGIFGLSGYVPKSLQYSPVFISITLLPCPPGFTLSAHPHKCECDERVLEFNLTCNINDQTVHREGTTWINAFYGNGNSSNGVIVHEHCPFGYCKQDPVDVDLTNPDTQCAYDRSGTLCGACKPNFSLALGSNRCLESCSNNYLSLLIPFALAGFALVFFIKILNLTVSQGTLNGLVFYANIVAANQTIFFPPQQNNFVSFLSVFISWLNLDLGIETCFIDGLQDYAKTWLQFVFPFYVWAIAVGIIVVSHYSTRATKIAGGNSISVLATLFIISYAKLFKFIINIFSSTMIVYPDDSTLTVWACDANFEFLGSKHLPLFLFALAIVLLLGLPYIAVLLSAQWLRTQTHRKGLRWLKPFLDAYYGPFKDKQHYWVGVLLVVRGVLFVFFASFFALESNVNLLLIIVTSISLTAFPSISGRLYKKIYLSVLENSFFLNLGVLAAGTLYIRLVGGSQEALVITSVGIAFLQFVGIACFHFYFFTIKEMSMNYKKWRGDNENTRSSSKLNGPLLNYEISYHSSDPNIVSQSEVCLSELHSEREADFHQYQPQKDVNSPLDHSGKFGAAKSKPEETAVKTPQSTPNDHEDATTRKKSETVAIRSVPTVANTISLKYFAAKREPGFFDFKAPREPLLECEHT